MYMANVVFGQNPNEKKQSFTNLYIKEYIKILSSTTINTLKNNMPIEINAKFNQVGTLNEIFQNQVNEV